MDQVTSPSPGWLLGRRDNGWRIVDLAILYSKSDRVVFTP